MKSTGLEIPGALVTLPLRDKKTRPLDGFWMPGKKTKARLLIFVHGMGSNFYRSQFRKQLMLDAPGSGFDMLLFNNRGADADVATENFSDCLDDLDAALAFAKSKGYRWVALTGHSTGCQKITFHHAKRKSPLVKALVLAATADDLAICKRDLKGKYQHWLDKARRLVKAGKGGTLLPRCRNYTAHRFLSASDPAQAEAQLYDFNGPLRLFRKLREPVLALFPEKEQYAVIPVREAGEIMRRKTGSRMFEVIIIPEADHSFHGHEPAAARATFSWLAKIK